MTWDDSKRKKPEKPVKIRFEKVEKQVIGDLSVAALSEGFNTLEWISRQWTICVLREVRDGGITREEFSILRKGIFDGRMAFLNAWNKFVEGRTQMPVDNSILNAPIVHNSAQDLRDITDGEFMAEIEKALAKQLEEDMNGETTKKVQE